MELTIDQALQKATAAHQSGRVQDADRLYTAILKAQPKHPDANHNLGILAVSVGKVEQALPFFETALKAKPSMAQFWLSYIRALIKLDKLDDAKAMFDQAKSKGAKGDDFDKLERQLGNIAHPERNLTKDRVLKSVIDLRDKGEYDRAIDTLLNQLTDSPNDPNFLALLSHCHISKGNLEKATVYLKAAKDADPNIALVSWNESRLLLKQNKVREALSVAENAIRIYPDDVEGMCVIASCLRANGSFDESKKYLEKALNINSDYAEALINRGLIYLINNDKHNSLADFEKAYRLKPHIKQIWHLILEIKLEIKQFESAITFAEEMIRTDPSDEKIYAAVALSYQHLERYDTAIEFYKKSISLKPSFLAAWANLGSIFKIQGKLDSALNAYKKALSIKPDSVETLFNIGITLKEKGNIEKAIAVYKKVIALDPNNVEAFNNLGVALQEQGMPDEAINIFTKAVNLKPDYAEGYKNIGLALKDQQRYDEAVVYFQKAFEIRTNIKPKGDAALAPATTGLYFELTNKCNFHCVFCPSDSQKRHLGSMNLELVKKLYTEASEKNLTSSVALHLMGEPTLHPRLIEILDFGAAKKIKTELVTNGSTLVKKIVPKILDSLYGNIIVSHMTPTEETYHFRGEVGLSWERYISNIRLLVSEYMKRISEGTRPQCDLIIRVMSTQNTAANCTITETSEEARNILREWNEFVANLEIELGLDPFVRMDYDEGDVLKDNEASYVSYTLQTGIQLRFWRAFTFANTRVSDDYELEDSGVMAYCHKPFTDVGVLWNGDVTLCDLDHDGALKVGNINNSSIEEIIQNDASKKLRETMLGKHVLPSVCQVCQSKPVRRQAFSSSQNVKL